MDLPRLCSAQQLACTADLHVMGGQLIASAQIARSLDSLKALLRIGGDHGTRRAEQVGVGLMVRTTDAAAQLV